MYIGNQDIKFFEGVQQELMKNFRQQEIDYLTVQNIQGYDEDEDIYNEFPKEEVVFTDPITINAYIQTNTPEYTVEEFGGRYKHSIVVMVHKSYLEDMNLEINEGQFFRFAGNLFQIMQQTGREVQIWGNPDWQVYRRFVCVLK